MLHIERLSQSIDSMGRQLLEQRSNRKSDLNRVMRWLSDNPSISTLQKRLNAIVEQEEPWEGALPCTDFPLNTSFTVSPTRPESVTVIGVDGSQIFPDRHATILYYLIQCGALIFRYDGSLPEPHSREWLTYEDDALFDARGYLISNDEIGIKRTVQEMQFVADLCVYERKNHPHSRIFVLIDGPLLWPHPGRGHHISPEFEAYLSALTLIRQSSVTPVGYIDRPSGKWFLHLLWCNQIPEDEPLPHIEVFPLQSLADVHLMESWLIPGQRTSLFKRHNETQKHHAHAGHEIWFSYLNLGKIGVPSITRIEIPRWFAGDDSGMTTLHNLLLHQAHVLNGYPYVLARAHEQALVTTQDKTALDSLLERKLMEQGIMPRMSDKARQKSYLGHR